MTTGTSANNAPYATACDAHESQHLRVACFKNEIMQLEQVQAGLDKVKLMQVEETILADGWEADYTRSELIWLGVKVVLCILCTQYLIQSSCVACAFYAMNLSRKEQEALEKQQLEEQMMMEEGMDGMDAMEEA